MILQLKTPCYADGYGKFNRIFKRSAPSTTLKTYGGFEGKNADKNGGDDVFGAEKRRVYTGPNPLHNR